MKQILIDSSQKKYRFKIDLEKGYPMVQLFVNNTDKQYDELLNLFVKDNCSVLFYGDGISCEMVGKVAYNKVSNGYITFTVNCDTCKYIFGKALIREEKINNLIAS